MTVSTTDITPPAGNVRPIRPEMRIEAPINQDVDPANSVPKYKPMTDVTRHEMLASLAASEARVSAVVEGMRADAAVLRSELREGNALMKASSDRLEQQAKSAQASAEMFYAEAKILLAESKAALTEIKLAGEQNKTSVMGLGYKVAAWLFGAILGLATVSLAIYKAVSAAVS